MSEPITTPLVTTVPTQRLGSVENNTRGTIDKKTNHHAEFHETDTELARLVCQEWTLPELRQFIKRHTPDIPWGHHAAVTVETALLRLAGWKYEEITDVANTPHSTIGVRLGNAKRYLQRPDDRTAPCWIFHSILQRVWAEWLEWRLLTARLMAAEEVCG